jgi:WD40 repeat protein
MLWTWWLACSGTSTIPVEPVFVRGGVILPSGAEGRSVGGDRVLQTRNWQPGEPISGTAAPQRPECVALFSVPLGDVARLIAMGGEPPDTALAFSPDGDRLAIGAYTGELVVVDAWTGTERSRRQLPEALIKAVAWSADGATLYVAEQSADAAFHAVDSSTLADRWTVALADDVGRSPPPRGDDLYGVYTLPGAMGAQVLPDGAIVVSAVHGWIDADGKRRNQARIVRFNPDGTRSAAWPADGAADATLFHPHVDRGGGLLAVPVGRSAAGDPPPDLPIDAVLVLDTATLAPKGTYRAEPLEPWFHRVFAWDAVGVDAAADRVWMGTGDGRVLAWSLSSGSLAFTDDLGTPVLTDGVPIAASIGHVVAAGGTLVALTSGTNIPYGAADPSLRPPSSHPAENALWGLGADGSTAWTWSGPQRLEGLAASPDGGTVVAGAGARTSDARTDLFGAIALRAAGDGGGDARLEAFCPTAGPVTFGLQVADDGRIAVAEHPWLADGVVTGAYRVTVLR